MNRLQSELHRLYLPRSPAPADLDGPSPALIEPSGKVRAMVMEVTRPPSWEVLSTVWRGVQTGLELPAPAIAVSGIDGLQLWFSLAEPIALTQAHAFLEGLRSRFLPDIEPGRIRLMPASEATVPGQPAHAWRVPALQVETGNWSAFVAPDLVPVFAETPWLDIPPNEEGQASLLRDLETMEQTVFEAASKRLGPSAHSSRSAAGVAATVDAALASAPPVTATAEAEAKRFLLRIMNDDSVALALRIEAAKVVLQHANDQRPRHGE